MRQVIGGCVLWLVLFLCAWNGASSTVERHHGVHRVHHLKHAVEKGEAMSNDALLDTVVLEVGSQVRSKRGKSENAARGMAETELLRRVGAAFYQGELQHQYVEKMKEEHGVNVPDDLLETVALQIQEKAKTTTTSTAKTSRASSRIHMAHKASAAMKEALKHEADLEKELQNAKNEQHNLRMQEVVDEMKDQLVAQAQAKSGSQDAEDDADDDSENRDSETDGQSEQRQLHDDSEASPRMRFRSKRTGLFKKIGKFVGGLFKKKKKTTTSSSDSGKTGASYVEDCTACEMVWKQVEMDVGNARYIEDVQASFEHNCMDAQKSTIFYEACEDMYDDMYALTDDYMSGKYDTENMCKRAKMCG